MYRSQNPIVCWRESSLSFDAIAARISPGIEPGLLPERAEDLEVSICKAHAKHFEIIIGPVINDDEEGVLLLEFSAIDKEGNQEPGVMTCERRCQLHSFRDLEESKSHTIDYDDFAAPWSEATSKYFTVVATLLTHATSC